MRIRSGLLTLALLVLTSCAGGGTFYNPGGVYDTPTIQRTNITCVPRGHGVYTCY